MSETPVTLHGSKCLVTGYGRIGKILSKMLRGIGARVSVEARKYADLALIEGNSCEAISLGELGHHVGEYDVIFNTVPSMLFDADMLGKVKKDALIIDLASRPGGVDFYLDKVLILSFCPSVKNTFTYAKHCVCLACCYVTIFPF